VRRRRTRSRNGLIWAIVICTAVPTAIVLSLWDNLTQPFWFNEQWRADYISASGNWWVELKNAGAQGVGAPFPAGWYFLERVSGVLFGSTELALRIPTALFLPLGCVLLMLLARRWMSTSAAVVVALIGTLTTSLLSYAVQLQEYEIDATAAVAVVLLHEIAWDAENPGWRSYRTYLAYAGIAGACIFSTPVIFLAAPLLLLDAARALRARRVEPRIVSAVGAGVLILAHMALFVLPQNANDVTKGSYWNAQFVPHHGFGSQIAFVWDGLGGFVTGPFTTFQTAPLRPIGLTSPTWSWILSLIFGVLLCIGIAELVRSPRGRTMVFALGGSLVLTLVASYLRDWPFGFVRTNFYLVPLLVLMAGIGAFRTVAWARSTFRRVVGPPAGRRPRLGGLLVVAALAVAVIVVGLGFAATDEVTSYRQIRASTTADGYGGEIVTAVAAVRAHAHPGAALVVSGLMAVNGWDYYQFEYAGNATRTGPQIAESHVDFVIHHGSPSIARLLDRSNPSQIFYYLPFGTTQQEIALDVNRIEAGRVCRRVATQFFTYTGVLATFSCSTK
jgi:hypothetical protein